MKKVVFYNHYHSGDIHVSRSFVNYFINLLGNEYTFNYFHTNSSNLLEDIKELTHIQTGNYDNKKIISKKDNTLYINTWYGVSPTFAPNRCTLNTLYALFNKINLYITGKKIGLSIQQTIPKINFNNIHTELDKKFLLNNFKKTVFVSNCKVLSGQCENFDFLPYILTLAKDYKDVLFIITNTKVENQSNVIEANKIINKSKDNLNQLAFLSMFCDVIVGKTSGPYTFSLIEENLMNKNKTFVCFANNEKIGYWEYPKKVFKCKTLWSNNYSKKNIVNLIEKSL